MPAKRIRLLSRPPTFVRGAVLLLLIVFWTGTDTRGQGNSPQLNVEASSGHATIDSVDTSHGNQMIRAYFADQIRQIESAGLTAVGDLEDWQAQRENRRQELRRMLGLDPLPTRTDLNPTITGRLEHDEFTVEKLHFQSMPGLYVTANLYIPKDRQGPLPGVLYVCGHANVTEGGVSFGSKTAYQRHPAWYARNGYVALIIDTIQLGEVEGVHHGTYRLDRWWWWNRGYTPAGVETWNGIRALDYLASRAEVDPERLAVTGRSGGGIYSWFITALDDRVAISAPTAGITDLADYVGDEVITGHCDCMFMVNSGRWDFSMVSALAAPRPVFLANGDVDPLFPLDGVRRVCRETERVYDFYGMPERLDHLIVEAAHEDTHPLQQATFQWMHRHLHGEELVQEIPAEALFEPADLKVFDELPEDAINTRIDELFVQPAPVPDIPESRDAWRSLRGSWMDALRSETFGGWPTADSGAPGDVSSSEQPAAKLLRVEPAGAFESPDVMLEAVDFDSQSPVRLRLWLLTHQDVVVPDTVVLSAVDEHSWPDWLALVQALAGEDAAMLIGPGADATAWPNADPERLAEITDRLLETRTALAVIAPRGVGATSWTETDRGHGIRRSFMLLGQTLEGMQIWDLRRAVQLLRSDATLADVPLTLEGSGTMGGAALYAGLFEPGVSALELYDLPATHRDGPILLNVRRIFDVPQAVAAALESVEHINLYHAGTDGSAPTDRWAWPRSLVELGHTEGRLHTRTGSPWLGSSLR